MNFIEKKTCLNTIRFFTNEKPPLKGFIYMGYPKKHRGRRKIGSKKRRARKRNKRK